MDNTSVRFATHEDAAKLAAEIGSVVSARANDEVMMYLVLNEGIVERAHILAGTLAFNVERRCDGIARGIDSVKVRAYVLSLLWLFGKKA
ncbi:MAG: hypothetical protein ACOVQH_06145 [Burkholderiaceae bacterium]|jgi:hypothetical protein